MEGKQMPTRFSSLQSAQAANGVSFSDFDFGVEIVRKSGKSVGISSKIYDVVVSWKNPGKSRQTANYSMNFTNLSHNVPKMELNSVAIGSNRFKRGGKVVMVFNNKQLEDVSAPIRGMSDKYPNPVAFSKAHVQKVFDEFGIIPPDKENTWAQLFIKLIPIESQPGVFVAVPVFFDQYDYEGRKTRKEMQSVASQATDRF